MTPLNWSLPTFAVLAVVALASRAEAQQPKAPIITYPQINTLPGIPAWQLNRPVYNPGPFYNPALNNPYMNQTRVVPFTPHANQPVLNPLFPPNNPFVNNPFALGPRNNPFVNNPVAPQTGFGPFTTYTPPVAFRQPGQLFYRGPDLQVNPTSGLRYRPLSGIARTADGSTFYRVPGSGLPTFTGAYSPGTGLYYDPEHNTFLNPATGVISRPGVTNVFIPWIR